MDIFNHIKTRQVTKSAAELLDKLAGDRETRDPAYREVGRICALPIVYELAPEEVEEFSRQNLLATAFHSGYRFKPDQANAITTFDLHGGAFCIMAVGSGKTLVSLMIAQRAFEAGTKKSLLLIPASVFPQFVRELPGYRRKVNLSVPFFLMGGATAKRRRSLARTKQPGCHVLPYSCLSSTKEAEEILHLIGPELIIADEAHSLKNPRAARTARVRRYMEKANPRLVAMSGTITNKSVLDYWPQITRALGINSPLPMTSNMAHSWAQVLDSQGSTDGTTGPILPLIRWARDNFPEDRKKLEESVRGFRHAYKLRLRFCPGVVASTEGHVGSSLIFSNRPAKSSSTMNWLHLKELEEGVVKEWVTPTGDEIDHAIHQFKWLDELSAGFYNELYWPEPKTAEEEDALVRAKEHHELQNEYHRELRKWLSHRSRPGMDTPFLVGQEMHRNGKKNVGADLYDSWFRMKGAEFDGMPVRLSRPIRICDYKITDAVRWAKGLRGGGILWVHHQGVGEWLIEELQKAEVPSLYCPAGNVANREVGDPKHADKFLVASISAHGTGKNLQHFHQQLVVQWPRSASRAEQLLGRTHREGQKADELVVITNLTTPFDHANFAACLNDATYIHDTSSPQKLLYGSYETAPRVVDSSVLRQQGFENKQLTGEQIAILRDKFGEED